MAYQIKTWKTGSNSILQPLWGIKRGSPTGMEAELRLFHPPSVLPPPLWTIFHSLRPPLPSPCWSKCMSWALSPWAPPGQTRETNTHPQPWRERHPAHLTSGVAKAQSAWSEVLVAQSCPTLWDPMDYSPPGPSVHGILQPRILEWVTIPFSKTSTCIHTKSLQSSWTFCNQMDHSPPGLSVHGILQARKVEWVAMPSSRGSSWPGDRTLISMFPALSRKFFTTSAA